MRDLLEHWTRDLKNAKVLRRVNLSGCMGFVMHGLGNPLSVDVHQANIKQDYTETCDDQKV